MAGGKQSARQKMINLMYLVFIAMLALNMSKEVLSAFGLMDERLIEANSAATDRNNSFMDNLALKAQEQPEQYAEVNDKALQLKELSANMYDYLESLKSEMVNTIKNEEDKKKYEVQDKSDYLDQKFFNGDKITKDGQEFLDKIEEFRTGVIALIGDSYASIIPDIERKFSTEDVKPITDPNVTKSWLDYHFKGFPLIASKTKMSQMQADVKTIQSEILSKMLSGQQEAALSFTQYNTLLEQTKSVFYSGEPYDGGIVLGRKDPNTKPNRVELTLDGRPLEPNEYTIENGKVKLNISAGRAGDHSIQGNLIFLQDGKEIEIPVESSFTTINKPDEAVIAAEKMNVVYRGLDNPMIVSIPGIPTDKVSASASGGSWKSRGGSKYNLSPGSGKTVKISARGTLPDGKTVSSSSEFRIKNIPAPTGTIRRENSLRKCVAMPRSNLQLSTVGAELPDFVYDLSFTVTQFTVEVSGEPPVKVNGNKLNSAAKAAVSRAPKGANVSITNIKGKVNSGSSYSIPEIGSVCIRLTD
jgi:gliding motility-associated protein GldM